MLFNKNDLGKSGISIVYGDHQTYKFIELNSNLFKFSTQTQKPFITVLQTLNIFSRKYFQKIYYFVLHSTIFCPYICITKFKLKESTFLKKVLNFCNESFFLAS